MDFKVLTAVFLSLTAIATGLNTGSLQTSDIKKTNLDNPGKIGPQKIIKGIKSIYHQISKNPKPNKSIKIEISKFKDTINIKKAEIQIKNFKKLKTKKLKLKSDKKIILLNFTGKIKTNNTTKIKGKIKGYKTSGVKAIQTTKIQTKLNTTKIKANNIKRTKLNFQDITATIKTNKSTTTIKNTEMKINSFSGSITYIKNKNKVNIEGKIDKLKSGNIILKD